VVARKALAGAFEALNRSGVTVVHLKGGKVFLVKDYIFDLGENFKRSWSALWQKPHRAALPAAPASVAQRSEEHPMVRESDVVTVMVTGDAAVLAIAKSLLDDAGIAYRTKNEHLQHLFGGGVVGTGYNILVGPVQLQVRRVDEAEARMLLADLVEGRSAEP
jgi:hypothetical protein